MTPDTRKGNGAPGAFGALRRFTRPPSAAEQCELCSAPLAPDHAHLVELAQRRLTCACDACAVLFSNQVASNYRRVPRRVQYLADFRLSDIAWAALQLPIELAFFLHSTPAGRVVALYPSPAGATEALVDPGAWAALVEDNPVLQTLEPDVEALLVNRIGAAREYFRVGVDNCYKLVGLLRQTWRGLSGGPLVWGEIAGFFADLRERSGHA
jgi:hypothetical protein